MTESARSRFGRAGRAAGLVLAGALAATALTGVSFAQDTEPDSAADERPEPHRFGGPGKGALLHGEQTIRTPEGDYLDVAVQIGSIEAADATSITVTSEDGYTASYALTDQTLIRVDRTAADAEALEVGQPARVLADSDGAALRIGSNTEAGAAELSERREQRQERRQRFLEQHGDKLNRLLPSNDATLG